MCIITLCVYTADDFARAGLGRCACVYCVWKVFPRRDNIGKCPVVPAQLSQTRGATFSAPSLSLALRPQSQKKKEKRNIARREMQRCCLQPQGSVSCVLLLTNGL